MNGRKLFLAVLLLTAVFALAAPSAAAEDVAVNTNHFPAEFCKYINEHIDTNGDGLLSDAEREAVTEINWGGLNTYVMTGLEYFPNLEVFNSTSMPVSSLDFSGNPKLKFLRADFFEKLTSINISACTELRELSVYRSALTSLDLSACANLETVNVDLNQIASLTMGSHPHLTKLCLRSNQVPYLDVRACPALTELQCEYNEMNTLLIGDCPNLTTLNCKHNQIERLDVSRCPALTTLYCEYNPIARLDLSRCTELISLNCSGIQVAALDFSNNNKLTNLWASEMGPVVTAVDGVFDMNELPDFDFSRASFQGWNNLNGTVLTVEVGGRYSYKYDCGRDYILSFMMTVKIKYVNTEGVVPIDEEHFPDPIFRQMIARHDVDKDGVFGVKELRELTSVSLNSYEAQDITSLRGLEYFTNLENLYCGNLKLTELDLSGFTHLSFVNCVNSQITRLNISGCAELESLYCENNNLQSLDLSGCVNLRFLRCGNNQLTELILDPDAPLQDLMCENNALSRLNVGYHPELITLYCQENALRQLDVSGLPSLRDLRCGDNLLTSLDLSGNPGVQDLECEYNLLSSLDVSGLPTLGVLICWGNQLKTLDLSKNTNLSSLNCAFNQLTCLDVSNAAYIVYLACNGNQYNVVLQDSYLYLRNLPGFNPKKAYNWSGGWVKNDTLYVNKSGVVTYQYNIGKGMTAEFSMYVTLASGLGTDIPIDEAHFPDPMFRACVTGFADADGNGVLSEAERDDIAILSVDEMNIASLQGLEYFSGLTALTCADNRLTSLDLSGNPALVLLDCSGNQLTSLDVSVLPDLTILACDGNRLSNLNVSANPGLLGLSCRENSLTQLDVSANPALTALYCDRNRLTALDLSHCPALTAYIESNDYNEYGDYASFGGRNGNIRFDLGVAVNPAKQRSVLTLPASLTEIGEEAFIGISANVVIAPVGLKTIGPRAFADCPALKEVRLPDTVTHIADDAFAGSPNAVLVTSAKAVQEWAEAHGVAWKEP